MLALQLTITGLQTGALYALTAVGFSLIFGSTRIFHFAHGATFIIAAYLFYYMNVSGYGLIAGIAAATAGAIAFGLLLNRFVYVPIQRDEGSFFTVFVASFGIGIVVQNVVGMIFGRGYVTVSTPLSFSVEIMEGLYVAPIAWISMLCAAVFFGILWGFLKYSQMGKALRALADNPELVRVFGLNPRFIAASAFTIGSILVVPAAIISGLNPAMGHHVMLISLAATIVGGIGSVPGTLLAGLALGLAESLALLYVDSQWTEAVTFAILFLFIIIRPSGLLGRSAAH